MGAHARTETAIACVIQRDDELESLAETSAQQFPIGARVTIGQGAGSVASYDDDTETYTVELETALAGEIYRGQYKGDEIEQVRVKKLFFYPIKSCAGIPMDSVKLTREC